MQLTELEIIDEKSINSKISLIEELLHQKKVIIAFSGGVDSSVLAYLAKLYCTEVLLVMQVGYSVGIGEIENAKHVATSLDLDLEFIYYNEFEISENYASNPHNRCYYCKEILHGRLEKIRIDRSFDYVLNGTNASDLNGHRPGYQAIQENGVKAPLVDSNLSKSEIRWIAKNNHLPVWNKPATACLASRIQTGVRITKNNLRRVAKAEYFIKNKYNINVLRVRDDGENARIEVGQNEMKKINTQKAQDVIRAKLRDLGYNKILLDPKGYRPSVPHEEL